ncbi:gluconokinase [Caldicellulosiruptoraceae bacterium PP1]
MDYIIAVDIGTTSAKAVAFDINLKVIKKMSFEYPIYHPEPLWSEQNPDQILNAVLNSIRYVVNNINESYSLQAIVLSSAMHSIIPVDKDGNFLYNSIIWADNRSQSYADSLKETQIGDEIYKNTGTPIHAMSPLCKILWLKDNQKEIYNKTYKFISIKEYIILKLFNEYIVDYSIASATGLFNIFNLKWNSHSLNLIGITHNKLSEIVSPLHIIKGMKKEYADFLNIKKDIPFVIGASDGCLANLGCNIIKKGRASVTIGTSGAIRVTSDKPVIDEYGRLFSYILTEGYYIIGGSINNGGIIYKWFTEDIIEKNYKEFDLIKLQESLKEIKAGSDGLISLPFLLGERAPYWDSELKGVLFGLNITHKKEHILKSLMEGVIFGLKNICDIIEDLTGNIDEIFATGGFTKSDIWLNILADIFNKKVIVTDDYENTCLGAAILGFYALRYIKSFDELSKYMPELKVIYPDQNNYEIYKELFIIYKRLYNILKDEFKNLKKFQ